MKTTLVVVGVLLAVGCAQEEPAEPWQKAEPPPRPDVDVMVGVQPGVCEHGHTAYQYDPDRDCRYESATLCGLAPTTPCVIPRRNSVHRESGECWRFETCPPAGFDAVSASNACASNPTSTAYCPEAAVECADLRQSQCEDRETCRAVFATSMWDDVRGCWRDSSAFVRCEDVDLCTPDTKVANVDGTCWRTDACTECEDCEDCPPYEDSPRCTDFDVRLDLVRLDEEETVTEIIELEYDEPADVICTESFQLGRPAFLSTEGLVDAAPTMPQTSVVYRLAPNAAACPVNGATISARVDAFDYSVIRIQWIAGVDDCTDLYLRAKVRHAAVGSERYNLWVESTDACDERFDATGVNWRSP